MLRLHPLRLTISVSGNWMSTVISVTSLLFTRQKEALFIGRKILKSSKCWLWPQQHNQTTEQLGSTRSMSDEVERVNVFAIQKPGYTLAG